MTNAGRQPDKPLDRFHLLLTGALDGVLTPEEEREFEELLAGSRERQEEWQGYMELKKQMKKIRFGQVPEEEWERYWVDVYRRLERKAAWVLISLGAAIMLAYVAYQSLMALLGDVEIPFLVKAGMVALAAGGALLLVSVFREKILLSRKDKYREVQR